MNSTSCDRPQPTSLRPSVVAGSCPRQSGLFYSINALGGVESRHAACGEANPTRPLRLMGVGENPATEAAGKSVLQQAGLASGPSAPFNDCGDSVSAESGARSATMLACRKADNLGRQSGPQFPFFIGILVAVPSGCVLWALLAWWVL